MADSADAFADVPSPHDEIKSPPVAPSSDAFADIVSPHEAKLEVAPSTASVLGRESAIAGSSALEGLESSSDLIAHLNPITGVPIAISKLLGHDISSLQSGAAITDKLGITNNPDLAPQSPGESLLAAGSRGVGSSIPFAPLGPVSTLLAGGAGGVASDAARQVGLPGWAQFVVGVLPGLGIGGVAATRAVAARADAASARVAETARALEEAKLAQQSAANTNPLIATAARNDLTSAQVAAKNAIKDATGQSEAARDAVLEASKEQITSSKRGLGEALKTSDAQSAASEVLRDSHVAAAKATVNQASASADSAIEGVAADHGTSTTYQEAGTKLQSDARNWLSDTLPAKEASAWAPVDNVVAKDSPTPLDNTMAALRQIGGKGGALSEAVNKLAPNIGNALSSVMRPFGVGGSGVGVGSAGASIPTWAEVRALRSAVGESLSNPMALKDIPQAQKSLLYASITKDLRNTVAQSGDVSSSDAFENLRAFDAANAESSRLRSIAEGPISKIVSGPRASLANDPAPGKVAQSLLSAGRSGDTDLAALRSELPSSVDELAAAHLREAPEGWAKLSSEAQATLVPDASRRTILDASLDAKAGGPKALSAAKDLAEQGHQNRLDEIEAQASAARDAHASTVEAAKNAAAKAKALHDAQIEAIKRQANFEPTDKRDALNALVQHHQETEIELRAKAQAAEREAKTADEAFSKLPKASDDKLLQALHSAQSGHIGKIAGGILGLLHAGAGLDSGGGALTGDLIEGGIGGLAGEGFAMLAPRVYRGVKNLVLSPSKYGAPAAGVLSSNPLLSRSQTPPEGEEPEFPSLLRRAGL